MGSHWRAIPPVLAVLAAVAACGAFGSGGGDDEDDGVKPAGTSGSPAGPQSVQEGGATSSSGAIGTSSGTGSSSGSAPGCDIPCDAGFCDEFERDIPDEQSLGWTYVTNGAAKGDFFHIAKDGGAPCTSVFFAAAEQPGTGAVARMMTRPLAPTQNKVHLAFDFTWSGNLAAVKDNGGRAVFAVVTTGSGLQLTQPYIAFIAKNDEFLLVGLDPGGNQVDSESAYTLEPRKTHTVEISISIDGGESKLDIPTATKKADVKRKFGPIPGNGLTLVLGEALVNTNVAGAIEARFDRLRINAP